MPEDEAARLAAANGGDGALAQAGEELGTTAQQVRRAAAALSASGRVAAGDAARGAATAIERAGEAAAGTGRKLRRLGEAASRRPLAVVAGGLALGAGAGGLIGRSMARRRRLREPDATYAEAFEAIWTTASEAAGSRGGREGGR
jgi:hypothetical protein